MSRHWQPDEARERWSAPDSPRAPRPPWPAGATVGLLLVATACLGLAVALYQVAGPRDVFAP